MKDFIQALQEKEFLLWLPNSGLKKEDEKIQILKKVIGITFSLSDSLLKRQTLFFLKALPSPWARVEILVNWTKPRKISSCLDVTNSTNKLLWLSSLELKGKSLGKINSKQHYKINANYHKSSFTRDKVGEVGVRY